MALLIVGKVNEARLPILAVGRVRLNLETKEPTEWLQLNGSDHVVAIGWTRIKWLQLNGSEQMVANSWLVSNGNNRIGRIG